MAWTNPSTVNPGDAILASLWNAEVGDNLLMGNPVFTNEAARDAVITSPVEGQRVYLSAPTVPAATGASTFLPSGIQTIYNGSAWVCVTPVGAFTGASGTTTSASYTATLSGSPGTNPSVTLSTGTTAFVSISNSSSNSSSTVSRMSVAVSGATTLAASDDYAPYSSLSATAMSTSMTFIISGLTAGSNTFTLQYKIPGGITFTVSERRITVQGIA